MKKPIKYITHITLGVTKVQIEMDMINIKTKSSINNQNANFET